MRLGPLERRVLEALWRRGCASRVKDLQPDFPGVAYTTLMTTLDRLHRKGMLDRARDSRAFVYEARVSRAETVLSYLVEEVGEIDGAMLDALDQLVRERRRELEEEEKA